MKTIKTLDDLFDTQWMLGALCDVCDDIDGAAYQRIKAEWIADGKPDDIAAFIAEKSNAKFED